MEKALYTFTGGGGPLVATAIHDGHAVRTSLQHRYNLTSDERLREEDPFTGRLAKRFPNHIIGLRSRFELDLNRSLAQAVYQKPADAWGLQVWTDPLQKDDINYSHQLHTEFYSLLETYLGGLIRRHGYVIILDLHSYNHRREGTAAQAAPEAENPEINLGTGNMDVKHWRPVLDAFYDGYRKACAQPVDIRENIKFDGGYFMHWIHDRFGSRACALSVEFKKVFMDEWTGKLYPEHFRRLRQGIWGAGKAMERSANRLLTKTLDHAPNKRSRTTTKAPA